MNTALIKGKPIADAIRASVAQRVAMLTPPPCLAAVRIGDDAATSFYISSQKRAAKALNCEYKEVQLASDCAPSALNDALQNLSNDDSVDGIILLTPLPKGFDIAAARDFISPEKDVEGVTPTAMGKLALGRLVEPPPTAKAAFIAAKSVISDLRGVEVAIAGYSDTVGKPLALMLLNEKATVSVARSAVRDISTFFERAELIFACIGKAYAIRGEWIRPGCVVIDVGTNEVATVDANGEPTTIWVGDVHFESAFGIASAITPVPGGVGTITTAVLFDNLVSLAEKRRKVGAD